MAMVALECDGYRFHGARHQWKRDLERRTALGRLGWRVLHFTWDDVRDRPEWVVDEVRRSLRADPPQRRN
jgi:very-short-patch-repair endonuclease